MPDLKLTYFDFNGGRAEPARLAMIIGGVPFEDHRVTFAQWRELKPQMPFKNIPVLTLDGKEVITQSKSILRYAGKLANLYPTDPLEALRCDEIMDALEDQTSKIWVTLSIQDPEEKKRAREKLADGVIPNLLSWLQDKLEAHGGKYFADNRLTVADLNVFVILRNLKSGNLDHIPTDLTEKVAPKLNAHYERIFNLPQLAGRYD